MAKLAKRQAAADTKISPKGKDAAVSTAFGFATQAASLINWFQKGSENDEAWFQILDMFPIPIEVFAPDGTSVFTNRALIEFNGAKDASGITGKYNLIKDPVCNDQLGMREGIQKAFRGEAVIAKNYPVPIQDLVDRGIIEEKPFEKASADYLLYPVFKDDKLHLVVFVLIVRGIYFGRPDVARVKEYIDNHWQGEYDPQAVAKSVNMSVTSLYHLFKQHVGMPPGEYHKKVKVEHIKEALADKNMTIKEAFAACGEDSRGRIARVFKEITGLSPAQFRSTMGNEQVIKEK